MNAQPMTMTQVARYHRTRFLVALAQLICLTVITTVLAVYSVTPIEYVLTFGVALVAVYVLRVAYRRLLRLQEST